MKGSVFNLIDKVICNFKNDNDWQLNQTRTLDPFSLLQSNTLNQINTIYGNNIILTGMELFTVRDDVLKLVVKSGQIIKDKVLIQFKEDTIMYVDYHNDEFKNTVNPFIYGHSAHIPRDPKRITESKRGMWLEMLASPVITKKAGL